MGVVQRGHHVPGHGRHEQDRGGQGWRGAADPRQAGLVASPGEQQEAGGAQGEDAVVRVARVDQGQGSGPDQVMDRACPVQALHGQYCQGDPAQRGGLHGAHGEAVQAVRRQGVEQGPGQGGPGAAGAQVPEQEVGPQQAEQEVQQHGGVVEHGDGERAVKRQGEQGGGQAHGIDHAAWLEVQAIDMVRRPLPVHQVLQDHLVGPDPDELFGLLPAHGVAGGGNDGGVKEPGCEHNPEQDDEQGLPVAANPHQGSDDIPTRKGFGTENWRPVKSGSLPGITTARRRGASRR